MKDVFLCILLNVTQDKTLRTLGDRSFAVASPALWNNLPKTLQMQLDPPLVLNL